MSGSLPVLVLSSVVAIVGIWQPDSFELRKAESDFKSTPLVTRSEFRRGFESFDQDYKDLRADAIAAPGRARSLWNHIRSNAAYTIADAERVARHLPIVQKISAEPVVPKSK